MIHVKDRPEVKLGFVFAPVFTYADGDKEKSVGVIAKFFGGDGTPENPGKFARFASVKLSDGTFVIYLYDWMHLIEERIIAGEDLEDDAFEPDWDYVRINDLYYGRFVDEMLTFAKG